MQNTKQKGESQKQSESGKSTPLYKTPQRLKGFNDFFGRDMRIRQFVINTFIEVFEKYGYEPLETPALEYSELILGQSGEEAEKLYYRFKDNGGRDVMLKYEVMISMCRALAQNINNVAMPYKRYQIQRVWRAENVQKGRYREFTQCDADTIGSYSVICDAEFIQMGLEVLQKLGFKEYRARISNRKFLQGLAQSCGIEDDKFYEFAMSVDKFDKIGKEKVVEELVQKRGISQEKAQKSVGLLLGQVSGQDASINTMGNSDCGKKFSDLSFDEKINFFIETVGDNKLAKEGLDELTKISQYLKKVGLSEKNYIFDSTIARGLASYTGPVWEFEIVEGGVGSVAGCGRYDKAIQKYVGYEVPATGGSFGIERLCDIIKDRKMWDFGETPAQVLITVFNEDLFEYSLEIAQKLRKSDVKVMLYPDIDKLSKQIKYADRKGIKYCIIAGPDEYDNKTLIIKDLSKGLEEKVSFDKLEDKIFEI